MTDSQDRISVLLRSTDAAAADELLPLVYDQLRQLAMARLRRERPGQTLQATALVHEAYLRVRGGGDDEPAFDNRRQFFLAAAEAMRRILIEQARRKKRLRHGGDAARVPLDEDAAVIDPPRPIDDLLSLEEALQSLEAADPRAREIVNCRHFAGFSDKETADVLGMSLRSVQRQWQFIRTFLQSALGGGDP